MSKIGTYNAYNSYNLLKQNMYILLVISIVNITPYNSIPKVELLPFPEESFEWLDH